LIPAQAAPARAPANQAPGPGFDLANVGSASAPAHSAPPPPQTQTRLSLAQAFGNIGRPEVSIAADAGAVDIRKITPARPKAEADPEPKKEAPPAKPPPPSHPSRIWVQLEVGRDKDALAFDWHKLARQSPEAFRGKSAYYTAWGQTNRLLAGPFKSDDAAGEFLAQLKGGGAGPHVWTSPAGQVVDPLQSE
jgi:hypothetical protein